MKKNILFSLVGAFAICFLIVLTGLLLKVVIKLFMLGFNVW